MNQAKTFSLVVVIVVAVYSAIGWYLLPLAGFDGELTRTGKLPESLFGWTQPQPVLDPMLFKSADWQDADVLVIGDSFSAGRVWQTQLVQAGLRVHTETWTSIRSICGDFQPWLKATGFKGRYIVIEIVERNALDTVNQSVACDKMVTTPATSVAEFSGPPASRVDRTHKVWTGRLSVGIETWLNGIQYRRLSAQPGFKLWRVNDSTTVARVPGGCEFFSHRACDDALFYDGDAHEDLGASMLDGMALINNRLTAYAPIWVIVPDKSTTYLHPDKQFWVQAAARSDTPNILMNFRQALRDKVIDLYPATNTHVSTTGYLRIGELVLSQIKAIHRPQSSDGTPSP